MDMTPGYDGKSGMKVSFLCFILCTTARSKNMRKKGRRDVDGWCVIGHLEKMIKVPRGEMEGLFCEMVADSGGGEYRR